MQRLPHPPPLSLLPVQVVSGLPEDTPEQPVLPTVAGVTLRGGPQMLQLSLDGRRLYVTNSLYRWAGGRAGRAGGRAGWQGSRGRGMATRSEREGMEPTHPPTQPAFCCFPPRVQPLGQAVLPLAGGGRQPPAQGVRARGRGRRVCMCLGGRVCVCACK